MPVYEVFLKPAGKDPFEHAGSLQAPDDDLAVLLARETYVRRGEGAEAWVVRRDHLRAVDSQDLAVTTHRTHASNDGTAVAARRKAHRDQP